MQMCVWKYNYHPLLFSENNVLGGSFSQRRHSFASLFCVLILVWLSGANSSVRRSIKNCVFCRWQQARAGEQKKADLPQDRVSPDLLPFILVGVDYFGPIEVKRGSAHVKRWGVIFTCLTSRAVHLKVSSHLNTDACINALCRFICHQGTVKTIRSDQGTNFIGAQKELAESVKSLECAKIKNTLLKQGVNWTFIPPSGPHHGGVWERLIRSVKKVSLFCLKGTNLGWWSSTALCEVEAIINDRPITTVTNDPTSLSPSLQIIHCNLRQTQSCPPDCFRKITYI